MENKSIPQNQDFYMVLRRGVIFTTDNMVKRNWKESKAYNLFQDNETIHTCFLNANLLAWIGA